MTPSSSADLQRLTDRTTGYTDVGRSITNRSCARRDVIDIRVLGYHRHRAGIAAGTVNDALDIVSVEHAVSQMRDVSRSERASPRIGDRDRRVLRPHLQHVLPVGVKESRIPITHAVEPFSS